jgi:hypothetical protein
MTLQKSSATVTALVVVALLLSGCASKSDDGGMNSSKGSQQGSESTSLSEYGEACAGISPETLAANGTTDKTYAGSVYTTAVQVIFGAWRFETTGDVRFPITCETVKIEFRVEWDTTIVKSIDVILPCIAAKSFASGASPLNFTVHNEEILYPDDSCRAGFLGEPLLGLAHVYPRHEYKWQAVVTNLKQA